MAEDRTKCLGPDGRLDPPEGITVRIPREAINPANGVASWQISCLHLGYCGRCINPNGKLGDESPLCNPHYDDEVCNP